MHFFDIQGTFIAINISPRLGFTVNRQKHKLNQSSITGWEYLHPLNNKVEQIGFSVDKVQQKFTPLYELEDVLKGLCRVEGEYNITLKAKSSYYSNTKECYIKTSR